MAKAVYKCLWHNCIVAAKVIPIDGSNAIEKEISTLKYVCIHSCCNGIPIKAHFIKFVGFFSYSKVNYEHDHTFVHWKQQSTLKLTCALIRIISH